jgi:hypothetical protein
MSIEQAIKKLIESEQFKTEARTDAKLRVQLGRLKKGGIKNSAAIELLQRFDYKIEVIKKKGA